MIDAKQLMVGNWISFEGNITQAFAIDGNNTMTIDGETRTGSVTVGEYLTDGKIWAYTGRWICKCDPIPLTAEWLKGMGFTHYPEKNSYQLNIGYGAAIWGRDGVFHLHSEYGEMGGEITSVHQLQNLIKAVTGAEASIIK